MFWLRFEEVLKKSVFLYLYIEKEVLNEAMCKCASGK